MFEEWAKLVGLSGGAGGNPSSSLWFCGIEPGGDWIELNKTQPLNALIQESEKQKIIVENIPVSAWDHSFKVNNPTFTSWQFVQKVAKISLIYQNSNIRDFKKYMQNNQYTKDGLEFHLNLYPLPFPKESDNYWTDLHKELTGFTSKPAYRAWCRQHRLPQFRILTKKFKPRCILCFGEKYSDDFIFSFSENPQKCSEIASWEVKGSKKSMSVTHLETDLATVLLCPFLGQGGIMSDEGLNEIGDYVRKITTSHLDRSA